METIDKFPIILRQKIPFVSELLLTLLSGSCIVLAICFFLFMPALRSSNEMKVVTTITIIPAYVKWLILYSGIGFLVFRFLYKYIVITRAGFLRFNATSISLSTKKSIYEIPISNITSIKLIDPEDMNEIPRGEFFVIIYRENSDPIQFKLREYYDSDSVVDNLLKYESLKNHIKNPETLDEPDILLIDPEI